MGIETPNKKTEAFYDVHEFLIKTLVVFLEKADEAVGPLHRGLSPMALRILDFITDNPETSQHTLVARLPLDKGLAARVIKTMEQHGIIERHEDPNDRRSKILAVTPDGAELAEGLRRAKAEVSKKMFHAFQEAEVEQLREMLQRMERNLVEES